MISPVFVAAALVLSSPIAVRGQSAQPSASVSVPRLVSVTGVYQPANGQPPPAGTVVTLLIYADPQGGTPVWQETQNVELDKSGRYSLLLGATQPDGIPLEVFSSGEAQWLALHFAGVGEVEGPRTRITSVPYALRAADADTLGGHPATAYLLAPTGGTAKAATATTAGQVAATGTEPGAVTAQDVVLPGTVNVLAKYVTAADVGASAVSEVSGRVGINTGAALPADYLHIRFNDPFGAFTGLAVQNLSNNANAASGMLFYDHNGALTQFQGFNNANHAYVINNIAKNGTNQFDGSYNFLIGSTSRLFVGSAGNIGIGTTAPAALFEVSNALPGGPANMWMTSFTNFVGPYYMARRARGTAGAPAAVQTGDGLSGLYGMGYGSTQFGPAFTGGITVQAAQNFTDTQQGTALAFSTTSINATASSTRMTLDATGNLGIGTTTTPAAGLLEASNAANSTITPPGVVATTFSSTGTALFMGRRARGTGVAPSAVLGGDNLAAYLAQGFATTGFSGTRGGMFVQAAENWTDAAQGTRLNFNTTSTGTITPGTKMTIDPSGNVGVGTLFPDAPLEVNRTGTDAAFEATVYTNGSGANPLYFTRYANGTSAAPTATQTGNIIGAWIASGYGTTGFGDVSGGMGVIAEENFTDAAHGAATGFLSTPIGSNVPQLHMAVLPSGFVGIGDWTIPGPLPTAADRLQVFGDIRVGDSGTNGCIKNFAGTQLTGTCVSDRRFKKNITPFGSTLNQLTTLQPVHFYWRAAEFPDRHFGEAQTYGLIAQDVERVFPELVVTGEDGFKAIDYSKLPLLTIQAVKELKAENDELKAQNDALRDRITEIERLIKEMRSTSQR
jgi:Chaperone of endosialidase